MRFHHSLIDDCFVLPKPKQCPDESRSFVNRLGVHLKETQKKKIYNRFVIKMEEKSSRKKIYYPGDYLNVSLSNGFASRCDAVRLSFFIWN